MRWRPVPAGKQTPVYRISGQTGCRDQAPGILYPAGCRQYRNYPVVGYRKKARGLKCVTDTPEMAGLSRPLRDDDILKSFRNFCAPKQDDIAHISNRNPGILLPVFLVHCNQDIAVCRVVTDFKVMDSTSGYFFCRDATYGVTVVQCSHPFP